jgi:DUF917 family protein
MNLGLANAFASYTMTVAQAAENAIVDSLTYCTELGGRLAAVQRGEPDGYERFLDFAEAKIVFSGTITDVERRTTDGFSRGTVTIESRDGSDREIKVEIQNEFLVATENGKPLVVVPDLICILDAENAAPITTETLTYGQRVRVVAMPCAPEWHRDGMLDLVGPRAFGFDFDYKRFE